MRGKDTLIAGSPLMSDQSVVVAVASYSSRATAELDFHAVWALRHVSRGDQVAAAVVEKGANGWLEMARHHSTALPLVWGVALLGSAITVVAAPLGITFLASVLATRAEWEGAAAIVGRFWHEFPKDLLRKMGNLLEAGQTGLVVVTVGHGAEHITPVLSNATAQIMTDCLRADLEADFATAVEEGPPTSPTSSSTVDDAGRATPLI
jgi:hypothetical protein